MKKKFLIVISILIVIVLSGIIYWNVPASFMNEKTADDISAIDVFDGSTGNHFKITDKDDIEYILNQVQNSSFHKESISLGRMGYHFRLTFYKDEDNVIDRFIINSDDTIRKDPFSYHTTEGMNLVGFLEDIENSVLVEKDAAFIQKEFDTPISVLSNGHQVDPVVWELHSKTWTDDGWLMADGPSINGRIATTSIILPEIEYSDDFQVFYRDRYITFVSVSVYDESFEYVKRDGKLSVIDELPDGKYYISIDVEEQGKFIESENVYETKLHGCVYTLIKKTNQKRNGMIK